MGFIDATIFILFIATLAVPLSTRFRIPREIFLFLGSCLISIVPGLPTLPASSTLVFDILLPPILFSAAYFTSWRDFKFNFRAITQLAVGLVIFTATSVAVACKMMLPIFTWPEAFLLGAIISPTDASATTSIIKKLGVPRRFTALLEGESLVNDATALTLYRFSLLAVLYGSFSISHVASQFFLTTVGGILAGLCIAYCGIFIIKKIDDARAETTFTFVIAYTTYIVSEHLGFSGVISTVSAGIYFGIHFPQHTGYHTKMTAKSSWKIFLFIINAFAFTLIGFELPIVMKNLGSYSFLDLISYGVIISFVVIAARLIWVFPSAYIPRLFFPSIAKKDPLPPWQFMFAFGWSGMRGIVSLAAALAIPVVTPLGHSFPNLQLIIFITYFVVVTTLILPTLTLPFLIKFLNLTEPDNKIKEEALARTLAMEKVIESARNFGSKQHISEKMLAEFINRTQLKLDVIKTQLSDKPYSAISSDYINFKKLTLLAVEEERNILIALRKTGKIHDEIFWTLSDELDIEEMRMRSGRV